MTSSPFSSDQQQPTNSTATRPPLQRSRTGIMLGGVSGGLAAHTGVDVLLWRVAFIGLTFAGGLGIPAYLALWLLMPPAPAGPADRTNLLDESVERLRGRLSSNPSDPGNPAAG